MKLTDFDYQLPKRLIAQEPLANREQSRLLVLHRESGKIEHDYFYNIIKYFKQGDLLISNNTKVIPARLFGYKKNTGAHIEVLLLRRLSNNKWEAMVRPGKRLKVGQEIVFKPEMLTAKVLETTDTGEKILEFSYPGIFEEVLTSLGKVPLPPYINKGIEDPTRYQTVYASNPGSAAAPTAGMHFTKEIIDELLDKGIEWTEILLHIGLGTFKPVKTEDIKAHKMHSEEYEIGIEAANKINDALKEKRRIIAVGTTSARALESGYSAGKVISQKCSTEIFIYPGFKFKLLNGIITNFHLPKSTLLMLVSAFAGRETVLAAYNEAIKEEYRFFSFGDAMLII